jgi:hypothetical protein
MTDVNNPKLKLDEGDSGLSYKGRSVTDKDIVVMIEEQES